MDANKAPTHQLGDLVAAAYDLGYAMTEDPTTAAELAARHLERVLVRSSNLRLTAELLRLARQLGPTTAPVRLPGALASVAR
jgi:hypothetical protein